MIFVSNSVVCWVIFSILEGQDEMVRLSRFIIFRLNFFLLFFLLLKLLNLKFDIFLLLWTGFWLSSLFVFVEHMWFLTNYEIFSQQTHKKQILFLSLLSSSNLLIKKNCYQKANVAFLLQLENCFGCLRDWTACRIRWIWWMRRRFCRWCSRRQLCKRLLWCICFQNCILDFKLIYSLH